MRTKKVKPMNDYNAMCALVNRQVRFSTAILHLNHPCAWQGKYIIAGTIPGTCTENGKSKPYDTEEAALTAILSDPWIQANPDQVIQMVDCSEVKR